MRHDREFVGVGLGYEVVVTDLEERVYRRRLIASSCCPVANSLEAWDDRFIRFDEEVWTGFCPFGERICARLQLIEDFLDAENRFGFMLLDEPFPESRTEVEPVVKVLSLDEDVSVKEIHQVTPRRSPSSANVSCFRIPRSWNASRCRVRPSRVSTTIARAKRLLARTGCVL